MPAFSSGPTRSDAGLRKRSNADRSGSACSSNAARVASIALRDQAASSVA